MEMVMHASPVTPGPMQARVVLQQSVVKRRATVHLGAGPRRDATGVAITDHWATTAMIPPDRLVTGSGSGEAVVMGALMTTPYGQPQSMKHMEEKDAATNTSASTSVSTFGTKPLFDCYISHWEDHMVGLEHECDGDKVKKLRTLECLWTSAQDDLGTVPLYRCFNNVTKDHAVSTNESCAGFGKTEFVLGHIPPRDLAK